MSSDSAEKNFFEEGPVDQDRRFLGSGIVTSAFRYTYSAYETPSAKQREPEEPGGRSALFQLGNDIARQRPIEIFGPNRDSK
jgi:hypothetical protein